MRLHTALAYLGLAAVSVTAQEIRSNCVLFGTGLVRVPCTTPGAMPLEEYERLTSSHQVPLGMTKRCVLLGPGGLHDRRTVPCDTPEAVEDGPDLLIRTDGSGNPHLWRPPATIWLDWLTDGTPTIQDLAKMKDYQIGLRADGMVVWRKVEKKE